MRFTMPKPLQIMRKVSSWLFISIAAFYFINLIMVYTQQINLFDDYEIKITGSEFVEISQIIKQVEPHMSSSLLSVDLEEIQKNIISLDYIQTAQLSCLLPSTLLIHVVERKPALLLNIDQQLVFMDSEGVLLTADKYSISYFPVPVVTLEDHYQMYAMNIVWSDISEFIRYILKDYPHFYRNLSEVQINLESWTFLSDSKTHIFANTKNLYNQLNILQSFEKTVYPRRNLEDYSYIDLRIKNQVIVREKNRKG